MSKVLMIIRKSSASEIIEDLMKEIVENEILLKIVEDEDFEASLKDEK